LKIFEKYEIIRDALSNRLVARVLIVLSNCDIVIVEERLLISRRKFFFDEVKKIMLVLLKSNEEYEKSFQILLEDDEFSIEKRLNDDDI